MPCWSQKTLARLTETDGYGSVHACRRWVRWTRLRHARIYGAMALPHKRSLLLGIRVSQEHVKNVLRHSRVLWDLLEAFVVPRQLIAGLAHRDQRQVVGPARSVNS